ncbi:MAG: dTMP kinase [Leptolyngbyaceae cyanobacterium SL_7_1]|nr:dTMP kinase [Leptolyngbyaceae cyanobacterium SL_7_1]
MKGKLIVFEGVEGCGKTTQLLTVQAWLEDSGWLPHLQARGYLTQLVTTREPGGTELGKALRSLLLTPDQAPLHRRAELLLYAADRAQHVEQVLNPLLQQGALILCDRFTDSTLAYQGFGRGIGTDLVEQLNAIATDGLQSDLTLWLDVPVTLGLQRAQRRGAIDRMEQADLDFHQRVQQGFAELARLHPQRIVRINANQPEAAVAQDIQIILQQQFSQWYPTVLAPS